MKKCVATGFLLLSLLCGTGCGQSGKLFLPEPPSLAHTQGTSS